MRKKMKENVIAVSPNELDFMRRNAPTGFSTMISEALKSEGYPYERLKVHLELTTLKDGYNLLIIDKARRLLKEIKKVEYTG